MVPSAENIHVTIIFRRIITIILDLLNRLDQYQEKCSDKELEKCEFIRMCLNQDPSCRPDAKTLSRHTSLFTISQLRILSAHAVHDYRDIYPREGQFSLDTKLKNIKRDDDEDKVRFQMFYNKIFIFVFSWFVLLCVVEVKKIICTKTCHFHPEILISLSWTFKTVSIQLCPSKSQIKNLIPNRYRKTLRRTER